jgi:hypothetical protein
MATADVEARQDANVAIRPYEKFVNYLQRRAEADSQDNGFNVSANMMDSILNAETLEDVWDADEGGLLAGKDLCDVFQEVRGFKVLKSNRDDIEGGFGVYIVVDAVNLQTGEEFMWETGAPGLIAKLRKFESMDALPIKCYIKGIPVGQGRTVLKLRPVPVMATSGSTA